MPIRPVVAWLLSLHLSALGACANGAPPGTARRPPESCDIETLGRALATDTSRLLRRERGGASDASTEGASVVEFTDTAGTRKQLAVIFYGETGNMQYRFHYADSSAFVVRVREEYYAVPITMGSSSVASVFEAVRYFCKGKQLTVGLDSMQLDELSRMQSQADSILLR